MSPLSRLFVPARSGRWLLPAGRPRASRSPRKPLLLRRTADPTAVVRSYFQLAFLLLNVAIGVQFHAWVRYYETGGASLKASRPPGVEGWLPIAALMNLKYYLTTGEVPAVHAAGMFLLVAFLAMAVLLRKSFCSWLCPIGTFSEWLWRAGQALIGRTFVVPRLLDIPLRSLKYILLGLFLAAVWGMSADAIRAFLTSPYGLIADVKMLDFFRRMGTTAAVVIVALVILSVLLKNAWCRYLCPYGALLGLAALPSPARIRRDPLLCIDCAKCAIACPSRLPVDRLHVVRSAECTSCLSCVSACPAAGALELTGGGRWIVRPWVAGAIIAALFAGAVGYARLSGHWHTIVPDDVLFQLVPRAAEFGHP
jgi:polyferredoxin